MWGNNMKWRDEWGKEGKKSKDNEKGKIMNKKEEGDENFRKITTTTTTEWRKEKEKKKRKGNKKKVLHIREDMKEGDEEKK